MGGLLVGKGKGWEAKEGGREGGGGQGRGSSWLDTNTKLLKRSSVTLYGCST